MLLPLPLLRAWACWWPGLLACCTPSATKARCLGPTCALLALLPSHSSGSGSGSGSDTLPQPLPATCRLLPCRSDTPAACCRCDILAGRLPAAGPTVLLLARLPLPQCLPLLLPRPLLWRWRWLLPAGPQTWAGLALRPLLWRWRCGLTLKKTGPLWAQRRDRPADHPP